MTIQQLVQKIEDLCILSGLSYDKTPPVAVSPGVYMFHAVEMNESCKKGGACRQRPHFAVQYGDTFRLG